MSPCIINLSAVSTVMEKKKGKISWKAKGGQYLNVKITCKQSDPATHSIFTCQKLKVLVVWIQGHRLGTFA